MRRCAVTGTTFSVLGGGAAIGPNRVDFLTRIRDKWGAHLLARPFRPLGVRIYLAVGGPCALIFFLVGVYTVGPFPSPPAACPDRWRLVSSLPSSGATHPRPVRRSGGMWFPSAVAAPRAQPLPPTLLQRIVFGPVPERFIGDHKIVHLSTVLRG